VPAGTVVTPPVLGLAAAVGYDAVPVHPWPVVTAVVTGDELLTVGLPRNGRVRDALGPLLPGLVDGLGGRLVDLRHIPDDPAALSTAVTSPSCDIVLVTGGCSRGAADHAHAVLAALDARFAVDGVACRPGHPQFLAQLPDGRLVVGLPGNPFAALDAALTLLAPILDAASGRRLAGLPLAGNGGISAHPRMTRLVPATFDGRTATPLPDAGSARLRGVVLADVLAVVGPGASGDQPVRLLPLPWGAARPTLTIGAADAAADHVWSALQ
jgi:molybdopterin molybdotransferase